MTPSTASGTTSSQNGMVNQPAANSPPPTPTGTTITTLPAEIGVATKPYHISLNRLITSRLSLCLPPHAQTPQLYTLGIYLFAQIYLTFEREWRTILEDGTVHRPSDRIVNVLRTIRVQALLRDEKIRGDLAILSSANSDVAASTHQATVFFGPHKRQTCQAIRDKPHILLAYTWVMYMALFNGGRWIRSQLISTGPDFWLASTTAANRDPSSDDIDCLSFWRFDGDLDGNDIKDDFKQRFDNAAAQLSPAERQDVVDEAVCIFKMCNSMVTWLDANVTSPRRDDEEEDTISTPWYLLAHIWILSLLFRATLRVQQSWLSIYAALAAANASWRKPGYRISVQKDSHSD